MSDSTMSKEQSREKKAVSRLVSQKLDLYINREKRENRFDPLGAYRTSRKMAPYDLAYKVIEVSKLDKKQQKNKKKENGDNKKPAIQPKLTNCSTQVTLKSEADRLTKYANEVFESCPVGQLSQIHRYRPHSAYVPKSVENGNVHNYSRHVGAALHQCSYTNYYNEQGLKSADPKKSKRMQGLTPRKEESDKDSDSSKEHERGNKKDGKQASKEKQQDRRSSQPPAKTRSAKTSKTGTGQSNKVEVHKNTASHTDSQRDDDDKYSEDFEEESRPNSKAEKEDEDKDDTAAETDNKKDAVSYTDDFESENESEKGKSTDDQQKTQNKTDDDEYSMNYDSDTSDKGTIKAESSDADSVISDDEVTKKKRKPKADTASHRSEDAASIQTYTSVEHAYDKEVKRN